MAKGKLSTNAVFSALLPIAPWIYINDASVSASDVVSSLAALIPNVGVETNLRGGVELAVKRAKTNRLAGLVNPMGTAVWIFADNQADVKAAAQTASKYQVAAIKNGCNFVSVNLTKQPLPEANGKKVQWGTNHLELDVAIIKAGEAAEKIFKWLFKVLTVPETLHLIPKKDMLGTDKKFFPDYAYCQISDAHKRPKDAKIQFVVLIASKPQVGPDEKLHWRVVDRTGVAEFSFKYRGPECKSTWDWVLKLQPGDRKALPRMAKVHVKEKKRVKLFKAPVRGVAGLIQGIGLVTSGVGEGLMWVGGKLKMGSADGKWVAEADIGKDARVKAKKVEDGMSTAVKKEFKIFNEKGERMWKEEDDDASTTAGSVTDEKVKEWSMV